MRENTIEGAMKYISGDNLQKIASNDFELSVAYNSGFGLTPHKECEDILKVDHYLIASGLESSIDLSWEGFWADYDAKISDRETTHIFWRRIVAVDSDKNIPEDITRYMISCRFSKY